MTEKMNPILMNFHIPITTPRLMIKPPQGRLDIIVSYEGAGYSFIDIAKIESDLAQIRLT